MPVLNLYSRRKGEEEKTGPDVYQYDQIPDRLRVQICRIFEDGIGAYWEVHGYEMHASANNNDAWEFLRDSVTREHGKETLAGKTNPFADCMAYLKMTTDTNGWLDLVELGALYLERIMVPMAQYQRESHGARNDPEDLLKELNIRFQQSAFGYRYESGKILRVDSEFLHKEVVKQALALLSDPRFKGAQEEFVAAHSHYRAREYKDAITDALNALESTLKTICDLRSWEYTKGARASDLIKLVKNRGLFPDYLDSSFDQLIATLQSGLPKVRNDEGGHGQGATPKETPVYVAAYALHLAAAKIVLLVEAFRALER